VWTTFSADQADLNYRNPAVLLEMLDVLLLYVERGAKVLRLDAVAYIWKEQGTSCFDLPQVHAIVRLMRAVLNLVAPQVLLLTETNVEQSVGLSYLGDGKNEANLVYNFALPPLLLHAFHSERSGRLTEWAAAQPRSGAESSVFNILATHDGVGLSACKGFLADQEIQDLGRCIEAAGGEISARVRPDGTTAPYELNINYMDALDAVHMTGSARLSTDRFVSAHGIMLALSGIPGLYFHSLVGSRGWTEGVRRTGKARSINREKLNLEDVGRELDDQGSVRSKVQRDLSRLLAVRRANIAFAPASSQSILRAGDGLFCVLRGDPGEHGEALCLHNLTAAKQSFAQGLWSRTATGPVVDLLTNRRIPWDEDGLLSLAPYEVLWLSKEPLNGIAESE